MKEKITRIAFSLLIMAIVLFQFTILANASKTISNELISWGLKREKNHKQPSLDSSSLEILNKYEGIAIGNNETPYLYLTFDLGYEAGYTEKILDVLKENNIKAVFFITAHYLNTRFRFSKKDD